MCLNSVDNLKELEEIQKDNTDKRHAPNLILYPTATEDESDETPKKVISFKSCLNWTRSIL